MATLLGRRRYHGALIPRTASAASSFLAAWAGGANQTLGIGCEGIMLKKNTAGQTLHFGLVNASTGAALAGATVSVRRCLDGTFAAATGTVTEDAGGLYKFAASQADTNADLVGYFFTATSAVPVCLNVRTTAADLSDAVRLGLTALPNAAANADAGLPVLSASGTTLGYTVTTAANVTTVNGLAANVITAASIAADAITAAKIANGAIDAATFAADVDAEILSYIVDDATRIDASALNTAAVTTIPAILEDTGTTLQAELDGIQADTEDIQTRLPAALVGGRIDANVGAISADATAADNAEAFFDGTGYAGTNNVIPLVTATTTAANVTTVNGLAAGVITAAAIAADAITDAKVASDVTIASVTGAVGSVTGAVGSVTGGVGGNVTGSVGSVASGGISAASLAADCITAAKIADGAIDTATFASGTTIPRVTLADTVTTLTGHTVQTGDSYAIVNSGTHGNAAIKGYVDDIGTAGAGLTAVPWNAAWDTEVQSEVDDALVAHNLDHLVKIAVDTSFATTVHADSVIGQIADNGAGFDRTTDSLEAIRDNMGTAQTGDSFARLGAPAGASLSADIAAIEAQTDDIGTAGAGLTAVPWNAAWDTEVQSEVQDAIEANHLDHLLAADYDPASKPGHATALLNEIIGSDSGVSQFTANALELGPSGSGTVNANVTQWLGTPVATPSVAGVPEVDITHTLGTAVQTKDGTLASATATTITLATPDAAGDTVPNDTRYEYGVFRITGGTGKGQIVLTTTRTATALTYNVQSGSMPVPLDNTSEYLMLGTWRGSNAALESDVTDIAEVAAKLDTTLADGEGDDWAFTAAALVNSPAGGGGSLDADQLRDALGMAAGDLDDQLDAILALLSAAGTSIATGPGTPVNGGNSYLVQGDDYLAADGCALPFGVQTALTLTGATLVIYRSAVESAGVALTLACALTAISGGYSARADLTAAQSAALALGRHRWEFKGELTSGSDRTLAHGTFQVTT